MKIKIPRRFQDELPPAPPYIPNDDDISSGSESDARSPFQTQPDSYGVFREYLHRKPSITPDLYHTLCDVSDSPYLALDPSGSGPYHPVQSLQMVKKVATDSRSWFFEPFRNPSTFRLMTWFYRPSITKSITKLNTLVKDVIRLGFVPGNDGSAFGFLDPNQVIRAIHLIPAFIGVGSPPSTFVDPQLLAVLWIQITIGSFIISECMSFFKKYNQL